MKKEQLLKNLQAPTGPVDLVLDTDTYNEIDDQFAIAYILRSRERLNLLRLYAAPFFNERASSPEDGMLKSYDEILHLLDLAGEKDLKSIVYKGSSQWLPDEHTPVDSPAARDLAALAKTYSPESPLYVVAIGAITNVASALLLEPSIAENIVVVWLGGHARHWADTKEFNMEQDFAAARVVIGSGAPFVQLPCYGVVSEFSTSGPELSHWLEGKNPLADYLYRHTVEAAESYAKGTAWTRVIWDVTAAAWLLNDSACFMESEILPARLPAYSGTYEKEPLDYPQGYVFRINRDTLMTDLFQKLAK